MASPSAGKRNAMQLWIYRKFAEQIEAEFDADPDWEARLELIAGLSAT